MLPKYINREDDDLLVQVGKKDGRLFLIFVSRRAPDGTLYVRECGNRATLEALQRWFLARHDRWQAWAKLAKEIGADAFWTHMESALAAEPPELVAGTSIRPLDDPRAIAVDELLQAKDGVRGETVYVHRFASEEMREHSVKLCRSDEAGRIGDLVLTTGWSKGSVALGRLLDRMSTEQAGSGDDDGPDHSRH